MVGLHQNLEIVPEACIRWCNPQLVITQNNKTKSKRKY